MTAPVKLLALESRIRDEVAEARAALKVALQHAANAGLAYTAVRDVLTQSEVQAWLASTTCADRHTIMAMRRISMCDLNAMARTLADMMLDRAAEHLAQDANKRSRSEQIEINRAKLQGARAGTN
jgi:hypothetical protein